MLAERAGPLSAALERARSGREWGVKAYAAAPAPERGSGVGWTREAPDSGGADRLALVDLLDRVLAGGVVVAGDVTLSIAGVDLVTVSLRALVCSAGALAAPEGDR